MISPLLKVASPALGVYDQDGGEGLRDILYCNMKLFSINIKKLE
jgi:hypothetical protein